MNDRPLKIAYITRMRFMSDKAHVYNTARTCEAIMATGKAEVALVSSDDSIMDADQAERYFVKHSISSQNRFSVISLDSSANRWKDSRFRPFNWLETILANITLIRYLRRHRASIGIVYFRDPFVFLAVWYARRVLGKPVFFEIHAVLSRGYSQFLNHRLARMSAGLINISYALDAYYKPYNPRSIVSFCAAAEPERFRAVTATKAELRAKLGLPTDAAIVGYSGNLWKTGNNDPYGIDDIIRALPLLRDGAGAGPVFMGVGKKGGETAELESLAKELGVSERTLLLPWVSKDTIAEYILASDILAIPAAGARIGNSPTKMFEYLVSGRPIVAANTEAISEVLKDGRNSLLVDYRKPQAWASAIASLIGAPGSDAAALRDRLVAQAEKDAAGYTWAGRGQAIMDFIAMTLKAHE